MAKKLTNEEKIVNALDVIDKAVRKIQKFAAGYDKYIDEAALKGNDARAKQLIRQKVGVNNLADQLIMLKSNIQLGAYTAQVMSDLKALPAALEGCKGLLAESPNFEKVGGSIQRIFKDMQAPVSALEKLNATLDDVLAPELASSNTSRLDPEPQEESDEFKAEYAAMLERIKGAVNTEPVAKPASAFDLTDPVDFVDLIKKENEKP